MYTVKSRKKKRKDLQWSRVLTKKLLIPSGTSSIEIEKLLASSTGGVEAEHDSWLGFLQWHWELCSW